MRNFTVRKTDHSFSNIAIDQAHEQNNAVVKNDGGGSSKTFRDYALNVFLPYVKLQLDKAQRVDIVWDEYRPGTLKQQARDKRGKGVRRRVAPNNAIPKNWGEFLRLSEYKKSFLPF